MEKKKIKVTTIDELTPNWKKVIVKGKEVGLF